MKEWKIEVSKITDVSLLRKCASFTSGKDCTMSLHKAYANKHSIIRSQLFVVEMTDIPLFCASQFVRSTQGVNWYQRTKRHDRGGADFRKECKDMYDKVQEAWKWIDYCCADDPPYQQINDVLLCAEKNAQEFPDKFDRYAPTDLLGVMNSEAIMNMSEKRLCEKASGETREIWRCVLDEVAKVDPALTLFCVKPCISHGGICREKSCGFNKTELFNKQLEMYKLNFVK